MFNLTNSEVIDHILRAFIRVIGRRTSESYAVVTIDNVLKEIEPTYDFLKYIEIKNTLYSEGVNAVTINPNVNFVEPERFYRAINELIKNTVIYCKKNSDFFLIKEFQEAIGDIDGLLLKEKGIDLGLMQFQLIVDRQQIFKIKNSEVIEHVIKTLTCLLNRKFPEKQAIKNVIASIKKLEEKYDFLEYIGMTDIPDSKGFYFIRITHDINNVLSAKMADAIQELIEDVCKSIEWKNGQSFIEDFKNELGEEQLSKLEKIGVKLKDIQVSMLRPENELLVKKTLDALVNILGNRTSESFAVVTIDTIINQLEEKHGVLKYITIDKSRYTDTVDAIRVIPDINSVDSYKIGKAIREIIKMVHADIGDKTYGFIEEFKNRLGDEYLTEIEKIGVNLNLLEMKFRLY